ncbi:MAG: hypothetical protein JW706_05035 [Opitutales bacterium]|nr:hypothetical protein [Opitutales bacterium]
MKFTASILLHCAIACSVWVPVSIQAQQLGTTNAVSQDGITWHFDRDYSYGTYVNGDYWVLGPVTITRISPDFGVMDGFTDLDGSYHAYSPARHMHGWEINPRKVVVDGETQGYDSLLPSFSSDKIPSLPVTITEHNTSVVKVIGLDCTGTCRPCLNVAAVLTVVTSPPLPTQFRPSYIGDPSEKLILDMAQVDLNRLPSVISTEVPSQSTFEAALERQRRLKFEHIAKGSGQRSRPMLSMEGYLPYATGEFTNAILYAMTTYDRDRREEMAIHLIQHGIDWIGLFNHGYHFPRGSGEQTGGILVPVFAATLSTDSSLKEMILSAVAQSDDDALPYEDHTIQIGKQERPLFGNDNGEASYWSKIDTGVGSTTTADPYGHIDGQPTPGSFYQNCCTSGWWKGMVLVFNLFPAMKEVWYHPPLETYVQRWVYHGTWTLPDPCAPYDGNPANRGITYGPDPNSPGDCIKNGVGRFPLLHGTYRDGGAQSGYVKKLWDTYYTPDPETPPHATIIFPLDGTRVHSSVPLEVSAYAVHGMSSVQFLLNGDPVGSPVSEPVSDYASDRTPPYRYDWNTSAWPDGTYAVQARATDQRGNSFLSASVEIIVHNGINRPPVLTPIGHRSTHAGLPLQLQINATDPDGTPVEYSATGGQNE